MRKIVIWGTGKNYEKLINNVQFEIFKGNISVEALVARAGDITGQTLDGFKIITKENVTDIKFDYLVIASPLYYKEIWNEAVALGIEKEKILNGEIFHIPLFDFARYVKLIENPVTILSDNCWGGIVYKRLHMKVYSPLSNIYWDTENYVRFIQNPEYYLGRPLVMEREGSLRNNIYPIGSLGGGKNRKVKLNFIHSPSFDSAKSLWDRRRKRINDKNLFVKFGFDAAEEKKEDYLKIFESVPYKKICFYSGETSSKSVVYLKRFEKFFQQKDYIPTISYNEFLLYSKDAFQAIDLLKLLNGEDDFYREQS